MNQTPVESQLYIPAFPPQAVAAGAVNGAWVNAKYFKRLECVLVQGAYTSGTPLVTFEQALDVSGTGAKVLLPDRSYQIDTDTATKFTNINKTGADINLIASANVVIVVCLRATDLDINAGFAYWRVKVAAGYTGGLAGVYVLADGRYQGTPETTPTAF